MLDIYERLKSFDIFICNEYFDKYVELIYNNRFTKYCKTVTNVHHIVPKYFYEDRGLDVDESDQNKVNLLYKDHILAHYYLARCSKSSLDVSRNTLSIRFILNGRRLSDMCISDIDLDVYQQLYESSKTSMYAKAHDVSVNRQISNKLLGRTSPNKHACKKIRLSRKNPNAKNKALSDIASKRIGEANSFYGKKHTQRAKEIIAAANSVPVRMLDLYTNEELMVFSSMNAAARYLMSNGYAVSIAANKAISAVCKGKAGHAYGFKWEFLESVTTNPDECKGVE